MVRFKKSIGRLSIKQRGRGKCSLERVQLKENQRLIGGFAQIFLTSGGAVRMNCLLAIQFLMNDKRWPIVN